MNLVILNQVFQVLLMASMFVLLAGLIFRGGGYVFVVSLVAMAVTSVCYTFTLVLVHNEHHYTTEKLRESVNSGELVMIPNDVVREVNDNYIVVEKDGKCTILSDVEHIDSNGNVYMKHKPNE